MSDSTPSSITIPILGGTVREVQAVLPDEGTLQQATQALLAAGFDRNDLSLPQAQPGPGEAVAPGNPRDEHDVRQVRTMMNSTVGIAGALVGGAIASVATGGALAPVAAAAVASAAGAGGLAHMNVQGSADQREAIHDQKGAAGTLLLSALVRDEQKEQLATKVLREAGATRVETVEREGDQTRPA